MGSGNGLATAIEMAGGFGDLGLSAEAQDDMFADADDAPSSLTPSAAAKNPRHRPRGSRNRSTEDWRRFVLSRHQSPLLGLAETWSRSAEDLARELRMTRVVDFLSPGEEALQTLYYQGERAGEIRGYLVWDLPRAFEMQQAARNGALPYLHQKQPMAVEVKAETRGLVIIGDLGGDNGGEVDAFALPLATDHQPKQNQEVTDLEPEKSDDEKSEAQPNQLIYREENQNEQ